MDQATFDLSGIETRPARSGWELKCPECGEWVSELWHNDEGAIACKACWTPKLSRVVVREREQSAA